MFSEEKDQERRSSERQRDGSHHGFIRHRIPYRLLGRRSLGAKRLVVSSKVLFPAIPTHNCDVVLTFPSHTEDATLMWLLARLKSRAPALTVHVRHHSHTGIYGFYLTAVYESLLQGAEELGILKPLKADYGGGMKEFVFEDQDCFAGIEDESSFLTSQERQNIVLHFLHELRATGEDSLAGITFIEGQPIVPLLIIKKVISQVFPLHNHKDLKVLRQTWVQAIFSTQPLDEVCQYFGVKIGLYFAYLGHYTTWLILPALVGTIIFLLQGTNQLFDDLCYVGFALFNVVWATLYLKFWKRASTEYCYRWGTLEKKDEMLKDPRPLFKGDLVKSPVTGHLELAYPSWKRLLFRYFVTVPIVAVCLAFVFVIMLLCFELQEWVNGLIVEEELPYLFSFVPKVLLAVVVSILDEIYKEIAIWLTHQENYRLEESHETSLIIKLVLFQFVNSFLSLFYIGFYLRDMDRLRDQLAALLITRQVLGNLKEALLPYIIWKARLYSVGYRIVTRMSPASVEKEVRRMTTRPYPDTNCPASRPGKKDKGKPEGVNDSDSDDSPVTEEEDEGLPALTQAEVESAMKKYEDTLDDYLEMCIQFGYITLFSSAFPLAALCALLNNIIEIRSDAFKLCLTFQRPFGQRVDSIGIWQDVLLVISVLAVIVNCSLIGTAGLLERMLPGFTSTAYCIIIVLVEHFILTTKFALYRSISDLPPGMAQEMARLEYQRTEALKQLVSQIGQNHGVGSLISHYPGSPGMRRRRVAEDVREASPPPGSGVKAPTVITATSSLAMRPTDFYSLPDTAKTLCTESLKPEVPPRSSVSSQPSSLHSNVADKIVAAAFHPMFDKSPSLVNSSAPSSSPVAGRPVLHPVMAESKGTSEVMKRVYRRRAALEDLQRRRSEPVASAVTQALSIQTDGIKEKVLSEQQGDLKEASEGNKDQIKKDQEAPNELNNSEDKKTIKNQSPTFTLSQVPGGLDVPLAPKATSLSTSSLKYSVSPRLPRGGLFGDPSFLATKILSRKSRSFSSADVSETKPAFRERFSWKGELPGLGKSLLAANQKQTDSVGKALPADARSSKSETTGVELEANDGRKSSSLSQGVLSSGSAGASKTAMKPPSGHKLKDKDIIKSDSETKLSMLKAIRESVSKPLSLTSRNLDPKGKKL